MYQYGSRRVTNSEHRPQVDESLRLMWTQQTPNERKTQARDEASGLPPHGPISADPCAEPRIELQRATLAIVYGVSIPIMYTS